METQKIVTLWNGCENEKSKFASIESSLCDYSDAYILVTGDISVTRTISVNLVANPPIPKKKKQSLNTATQVAFKKCTPFEKCSTEIDGTLADEANFINITMLMYNLVEYSNNCSGTSGS